MRKRVFAIAVAGLGLAVGVPVPVDGQACYPGPCSGADAELNSISSPDPMVRKAKNAVRIDGTLNNATSDVVTTLRARGMGKKTKVKPKRVVMFVPADTPYSVYFSVKPQKRTGGGSLTACTRASPEDIDSTNNCAATVVAVT